jgi:hypothetical protein
MSLKTILNEIETNKTNSEMDVSLGHPSTLGGRLGLKRAATEAVSRLKDQYYDELRASTAFIVVTGPNAESFSKLSGSDDFGCFSSDSDAFFKDLTSRINPKLFGRESVRALFNIASNILEDKAMELDIKSYNMLQFNDKYNSAVNKAEDFVPLVRNAVLDQVGAEIVGLNTVKTLVSTAIEKKHSAPVTPIVLNTPDERVAVDLFRNLKSHVNKNGEKRGLTSKVFLVFTTKMPTNFKGVENVYAVKHVSNETVSEVLTAIKTKIL